MSRRRFVIATALAALGISSEALAAPKKKKPGRVSRPARGGRPAARRESIGPGHANVTVDRSSAAPSPVELAERETPQARWRHHDLSGEFRLPAARKPVRLLLPLPADVTTNYQRLEEINWEGNAERIRIVRDSKSGLHALVAEWSGANACQLDLRCRLATRDRRFDITRRNQPVEAPDVLRDCLASSAGLEITERTRQASREIIVRLKDPLAQAHAIYDWVVDNTQFDARATEGAIGDPAAFLGNPGHAGSDLEINGLFVLLARGAGIPARRVNGWRVDMSDIVPSLGKKTGGAPQLHCRAEFYAHGYGWVPVDPADVRRALAADAAQLDSRKRDILRKLLFGFWEMNWIALGSADPTALHVNRITGSEATPGVWPAAQVEVGGEWKPATEAVRWTVASTRSG